MPKPKPNLVFGYSNEAFDDNQHAVIRLLSNKPGSYAMPAKALIFFFFTDCICNWWTPFVAENQAANGGAIAMNDLLKWNMGILGELILGSDSSHFFSMTLNNKFASVNAHWLSRSANNKPIYYYSATLNDYLLAKASGLRAFHQIVQNILDYAVQPVRTYLYKTALSLPSSFIGWSRRNLRRNARRDFF